MRSLLSIRFFFCAVFVMFFVMATEAPADKSAVEIEAPLTAAPGEEIVIFLHVSHSGNNFLHYTEWVDLVINDEQVQRWEYSMFDRPPGEKFTLSFSFSAPEIIEIEARASCNLHGSESTAGKTIRVEPPLNPETQ